MPYYLLFLLVTERLLAALVFAALSRKSFLAMINLLVDYLVLDSLRSFLTAVTSFLVSLQNLATSCNPLRTRVPALPTPLS